LSSESQTIHRALPPSRKVTQVIRPIEWNDLTSMLDRATAKLQVSVYRCI